MIRIPLEEWEKLSAQDRLEKLENLNTKPSIFQLLIMAIMKWLEEPKRPPLLDTIVFKRRPKFFK